LIIIEQKKKKSTAIITMCVLVISSVTYSCFRIYSNTTEDKSKTLKVAIITENIPATVKWDNNNINKLVHNYFILCQKALQSEPDLIIWTESAVPWTYTPNDDFLDSIASMSKQPYHNVSHIIGMNTAIDHNSVYNSAYFIKNGKTDNRQDKKSLLSLVE